MTELKRIDLNASSFECNGKTYYIHSGLSIERFCEYQILEKEAGMSTNFKSLFNHVKAAYEDLNQMKVADASVKLHNIMSGVARLEEREPTLLKICALFMNVEGEDITIINNDIVMRKIEDWKKEYDVRDFFSFALATVNGFTEIYETASKITSESKPKKK